VCKILLCELLHSLLALQSDISCYCVHLIQILEKRGYQVQLRGIVPVKGKGDMETYYVMGRRTGRAPGFVRQPSTYSSLATVVYGMLQARRRQTIKKSATCECLLRLMNKLNLLVAETGRS
jgi:hypothetical protein